MEKESKIESAAEWYVSVANFPENGDIEVQGMSLIRAIQLNVLSAVQEKCTEQVHIWKKEAGEHALGRVDGALVLRVLIEEMKENL